MEKTLPFYDLCIPLNKKQNEMNAILKELIDLGYKTIAIDEVFDHSKKAAHQRGADIFPEPSDIKHLVKEFGKQLKILQRLTIIYQDASLAHAMPKSLNLQKYNLIAGQPQTDAALTHCCTDFAGDIITFDAHAGIKLVVNRKAYKIALQRNMFFELKYSLAIRDTNNRKNMIKLSHNYLMKGKLKNIIMSSGANNAFELRSPCDVANLAFIFGLSGSQGKNAIDKLGRELFVRAECRRIGKTIMYAMATGPIVLSNSSASESEENEDEEFENYEASDAEESGNTDNENEDENTADSPIAEETVAAAKAENGELTEQPRKKQRLG